MFGTFYIQYRGWWTGTFLTDSHPQRHVRTLEGKGTLEVLRTWPLVIDCTEAHLRKSHVQRPTFLLSLISRSPLQKALMKPPRISEELGPTHTRRMGKVLIAELVPHRGPDAASRPITAACTTSKCLTLKQ